MGILGTQKGGGSYSAVTTSDNGRKQKMKVPKSPFFRPSDPRTLRRMSTPGGTVHLKKLEDEAEHKSTILGASANLIVSIVGAGIVGIPYALKEAGLVAGLFMVVFCAAITEKSLRLLVETAKHIDVSSYEVLYEASFGHAGFLAMGIIMFSMSYGAMISYMMIMKDSISFLLGVDDNDLYTRRAILAATTVLVLFPLSAQRDMADLAKTSKVSVAFYLFIVLFVIFNSPVNESVQANGGWKQTISEDIIRPETFFTGLGVLSFAYVCQHSSFIIAGSLKRPTKQRWARVTSNGLLFSGTLATLCGVYGYLAFLQDTDGNVLNNFDNHGNPIIVKLSSATRAMLVMCMFFVYPMDAFVSRHVLVVLFFKGRRAHEGDDHSVLARKDRRIILTIGLMIVTLLPSLLLEDLGVVLAITGAIAGSFLSYIGPGTSYLAVHGEEFIRITTERWTWGYHVGSEKTKPHGEIDVEATNQRSEQLASTLNPIKNTVGSLLWLILLMPIWVRIANIGQQNLENHYEKEIAKSPHLSRLGKVVHHNPPMARAKVASKKSRMLIAPSGASNEPEEDDDQQISLGLTRMNSEPRSLSLATSDAATDKPLIGYGSIPGVGGNRGIADALAKQRDQVDDSDEQAEDDPQDAFPEFFDFLVAIGFIVFGMIAMCIGLLSIFLDK